MKLILAPLLVAGWVTAVLFGGCVRPDHESAVRERAEALVGHLFREDFGACLEMTDPVYVRAQGTDKVKFRFKLLLGLSKLGQLGRADVRIQEVNVAPDSRTAAVYLGVRSDGEWKPLEPTRWVRDGGTWYFTF
jgi:hypothetical protein